MFVGELKKILEDYSDDSPVYLCINDNVYTIADTEPVCERTNEFGLILVNGNCVS